MRGHAILSGMLCRLFLAPSWLQAGEASRYRYRRRVFTFCYSSLRCSDGHCFASSAGPYLAVGASLRQGVGRPGRYTLGLLQPGTQPAGIHPLGDF